MPETPPEELAEPTAPPELATPTELEPPTKEERLKVLQDELAQNQASFESDFAKECAERVASDTNLEDLFYEDKEAFFNKILEFQNEKITGFMEKQSAAQGLSDEIALDEKMGEIESAKQAYESASGKSADELLRFFSTLSPEVQDEIDNLPPEQMFQALEQLQASAAQEPQSQEIPSQVQGVPSAASVNEPEQDLPTQRY